MTPSGSPDAASAPLYRRIADHLMLTIESRQMQPGSRLPTESQLCAGYGASRISVRKALDELVARRLIERRRGSGTYISSPDRIAKAVVFTGWIDDVLMLNRMTVLDDRWMPLPDHLAAFAKVAPGQDFKQIVGVNHITAGEPIVHIAFWFPPEIAAHVSAANVAGPLPTIKHVESACQLRVERAEQVLDAVSASPAVAAALGLRSGAPVLRALRAYYDSHGRLVEIFQAEYHPARYQFSATLYPRHG